jgi:transposase-like protein
MQRKNHSAEFKSKVVLKALSGESTSAEIAKQFSIHPLMITKWKKHAVDLLPSLFSRKPDHDREEREQRESELFQQIGQLQYELDWLKKKTAAYDR